MGGKKAPRTSAFGVANAYQVDGAGRGVLGYRTPLFRYALLAFGIILWVAAAQMLIRMRRSLVARPPGPAGPGVASWASSEPADPVIASAHAPADDALADGEPR